MIDIIEKIGAIIKDLHTNNSMEGSVDMTKKYIELVSARNVMVRGYGHRNFLEMQVEKVHRIPTIDWRNYLAKRDSFSKKYFPITETYSTYPHFLSKIPKITLTFPGGVFDLFKSFPNMRDIQKRIDLIVEGQQSKFQFHNETNSYTVTIAETNYNQKIAMLIHELSHVADHENRDHKIPSIYESERGAHKIEFEVAKSISEEFLVADIREYLACFVRTEFEQIVFEDPGQAGPVLFGKILTKYFGSPDPKESYLYLQDEKLIMKPFSDLSVAVAMTNLLM